MDEGRRPAIEPCELGGLDAAEETQHTAGSGGALRIARQIVVAGDEQIDLA